MDCLITDFPVTQTSNTAQSEDKDRNRTQPSFDESRAEAPDKDLLADIDENEVVRTRTVRVNLTFDGINYKMRLRKEESVFKVIDLSLDFTD